MPTPLYWAGALVVLVCVLLLPLFLRFLLRYRWHREGGRALRRISAVWLVSLCFCGGMMWLDTLTAGEQPNHVHNFVRSELQPGMTREEVHATFSQYPNVRFSQAMPSDYGERGYYEETLIDEGLLMRWEVILNYDAEWRLTEYLILYD